MKFSKNESQLDRMLRVLAGVIFFVIGYFWLSGALQIVSYVLSAISLITALTGFCGLYALLKINTCKVSHKK